MQEEQPLIPYEATAKLLGQFQRTPNRLEDLVATGVSLDEAACIITEEEVVTSFCSAISSRGQETEYLASWHSSVRSDCSKKFKNLKEQNPLSGREIINQDKDLQLLNGIRRGVHRAMVRNQRLPAISYPS
ncbi:MAG TPA: hypothetical protein VMR28_02125 [Candidatus Saccharimonadales bacterium]|nr:hypothetical protein [Candidatus Saccharimonadales bacterium]